MSDGFQAVILAGGKGKRLAPYTTVFPKPMMPVGDMPILEIVLRQLKFYGIDRVVLAVGHLSGLIRAFFGDGEKIGLEIRYSVEDEALGTVGGLTLIDGLDEDFLVMNGDVLTNLNYRDLMTVHKWKQGMITIASTQRAVDVDFGILTPSPTFTVCEVTDYTEKPRLNYCVSMGIYAFNRFALQHLGKGQFCDFPDLVKRLISDLERVVLYPFFSYWRDIGRPEDYEMANGEFEKLRKELLPWERL